MKTQAVLYASPPCTNKALLLQVHAISRNNFRTAFPSK